MYINNGLYYFNRSFLRLIRVYLKSYGRASVDIHNLTEIPDCGIAQKMTDKLSLSKLTMKYKIRITFGAGCFFLQ